MTKIKDYSAYIGKTLIPKENRALYTNYGTRPKIVGYGERYFWRKGYCPVFIIRLSSSAIVVPLALDVICESDYIVIHELDNTLNTSDYKYRGYWYIEPETLIRNFKTYEPSPLSDEFVVNL